MLRGQNEQGETEDNKKSRDDYWGGDEESLEEERDEERDGDGEEWTEQNEGEEQEHWTDGEDEGKRVRGGVFRRVPWRPGAGRLKRERAESEGEGGDSD